MKIITKNSAVWQYVALTIAWALLIGAIYFGAWTVGHTETGNGDNVEHLHATWLVAWGKVPYKDFFQHHNPLMWYIFAPLIKYNFNVITLLNMAHAIGMIAGALIFFIAYLICRKFFKVSCLATLTSLITLCPPYYYIFCFNYNPDTFMALAFVWGLYFLFAYFDKQQLYTLCTAFFCFFAAFLFTQKILVPLFALGIICLYWFYRQKTPLNHILYALYLPFVGALLFISWLYYHDMFEIYWKSNYEFNIVMQDFYGNEKINIIDYHKLYFTVAITFLGIIWNWKASNKFYKAVALLFVFEFLQRFFYFSIAPYYLLPLMIYISILNSVFFDKLFNKYFFLVYLFLGVGAYYVYMSPGFYLSVRNNNRSFARFLSQNITPCDYIISSYMGSQSIANKDPYYYWAILGHVDMAAEKIGLPPHPNISLLVEQYKPKLIFGGVYWSSYDLHRGRSVPVQQVDRGLLDKYYLPTQFPDFYVLKYEYRHKICQFDKKKGEWLYAD